MQQPSMLPRRQQVHRQGQKGYFADKKDSDFSGDNVYYNDVYILRSLWDQDRLELRSYGWLWMGPIKLRGKPMSPRAYHCACYGKIGTKKIGANISGFKIKKYY